MKHHRHNKKYKFIVEPIEFDRFTEKELLQYCLGATVYMPGTKNFTEAILNKRWKELTSMVMCFEDAISEDQLPIAEANVINFIESISENLSNSKLKAKDLPLIIIRVRNPLQFKEFTKKLDEKHYKLITGFNFPKFDSDNASEYLEHLQEINSKLDFKVYGLPILESKKIAYIESRTAELMELKQILDKYIDYILNIRVGATDFSSYFGARRGVDYTIYDISTVNSILTDILNVFTRTDNSFVVSAPVWEYFSVNKRLKFVEDVPKHLTNSLLRRMPIVDEAIDGLLREIILDKANGFIGKTIIHPTHIKYVNAMHAVTKEEYEDALQIMNTQGGVVKSAKANKMNEINPHKNWAMRTLAKSKVYGVIENGNDYFKLFWEGN